MGMEIDINDIKTMGDFRVAIQDAVEQYVSESFYGVHGTKDLNELETGGSLNELKIDVTVDFSKELSNKNIKHWGIFNIFNKSNENLKERMHNAQIIVWWNNNNEFSYTIPHNALYIGGKGDTYDPLWVAQKIDSKSVEFNNDKNQLSFTIISKPYRNFGTYGGNYTLNYHIW